MHLRTLIVAAALVAFGSAAPLAHAQQSQQSQTAAPTPSQVVKNITDQLSSALEGKRDELSGDQQKLVKLINTILLPHIDVDYASILILGRHAREATPEQREQFAHAFYESLSSRYAKGLLSYTRGRVKVLPRKGPLDPRHTVVRTLVKLDNGKQASVDYVFRKTSDGQWKAYDVIIEGISYITNYRSQVDAEIQKVGIAGLIKNLQTEGAEALKEMDKNSGQG